MAHVFNKALYAPKDLVRVLVTLQDGSTAEAIGEVYIVDAYSSVDRNLHPQYSIIVHNWQGTTQSVLLQNVVEEAILGLAMVNS